MIKVCIISCGMIANAAHIPAYKYFSDDFEIVGVCDINETAAKDTAIRYNINKYYTDAELMLSELKPDLVSICVPNFLHKHYVLTALKLGANVLCEKPLAFSRVDAEEMFELAEKKGKILMACQSMRFTPDRIAAKKYLEENEIGNIYYGELSRIRRRGIPTWGTFHMKRFSMGGAFIDIGVHMLDALVWLMGNPKIESVYGKTMQNHKNEIGTLVDSGALTGSVDNIRKFNHEEMDVEDFSCGLLNFENGVQISFKVGWAANMPEYSDIRITGKNYGIDIPQCKIYSGAKEEAELKTKSLLYDSPFAGHFYLIDNVRKVLNGEADIIVKPEETINISSIIEAFYKSAELNREVNVKELV